MAALADEMGGLVHTDAVQAAGRIAIEAGALGAGMLTLSAHKLGGPKGSGALVLCRDGLPVAPLLKGGGQERGFRAGTENVAAIAGFGAAAGAALRDLGRAGGLESSRDAMEAEIARTAPEAVFFAKETQRLGNTSCFAVPGMQAETLVIALDLAGVAVSAGSACSSGKVERSHVLDAMGVAPELGRAAIRVSLGWDTTLADVERFLTAWKAVYGRFAARRAAA
jgi:cysteine desulfurase